jgi:osmotically-inducible protein OsmY
VEMHIHFSLDSPHEPINLESRIATLFAPRPGPNQLLTFSQKRSSATRRPQFATYSTEASYSPARGDTIPPLVLTLPARRSRSYLAKQVSDVSEKPVMKRFTLALVFVFALATAYAISQNSSASSSAQSGGSLDAQIQQKLAADPALKNVQVKVQNGMADLTGTVATKEDRDRAKSIAFATQGVAAVNDTITVAGGSSASSTSTPRAAPSANPAVSNSSNVTGSTAIGETQNNTAGSIAGNSNTTSANSTAQSGGVSGSATSATPQASGSSANGSIGAQSGATGTGSTTGNSTAVGGTTAPSTSSTPQVGASSSSGIGSQSTSSPSTTTAPSSHSGDSTAPMGQTSAGSMSGSGAPTPAVGASSDATSLKSQIDNAIQSEPTLSGANIQVMVSDSNITLMGSAPTGKEKQTAKRIAQSYAGNRRVLDNITVGGRGAVRSNSNGASSGGAIGTPTGTSTTSETGSGTTSASPSNKSNPDAATNPNNTTQNPNTPPSAPPKQDAPTPR